MIFNAKKIIGIDIGTTSIKVVDLDVSKSSATLQKMGVIETPKLSVAAGDIIDGMPIGESISHLLNDQKIKTKQVCAGLWGPAVVIKRISVPQMEKKFVAEQIRWEAEQYIPFDINDVSLDYSFLKTNSGGYDTMDMLLVAARNDQIIKYVEIIETAGLYCSILDINGFALANNFFFNYGYPKEGVALLNIGNQYTNFAVLKGRDIVFCRDIPVGGSLYTADIQKALNISLSEAEQLKLSASGREAPEEVTSIISSSHEILCDEIMGSIDFFTNTTPDVEITKLYVSGGGSRTPGLVENLVQAAKIEIEFLDSFKKIKIGKGVNADLVHQCKDILGVSLGLGLRKLGEQ